MYKKQIGEYVNYFATCCNEVDSKAKANIVLHNDVVKAILSKDKSGPQYVKVTVKSVVREKGGKLKYGWPDGVEYLSISGDFE